MFEEDLVVMGSLGSGELEVCVTYRGDALPCQFHSDAMMPLPALTHPIPGFTFTSCPGRRNFTHAAAPQP